MFVAGRKSVYRSGEGSIIMLCVLCKMGNGSVVRGCMLIYLSHFTACMDFFPPRFYKGLILTLVI